MALPRINISKRDVVVTLISFLLLSHLGWVAAAVYATRILGKDVAEKSEKNEEEHDHGAHASKPSIELSPQALKNIGYQPLTVKPDEYTQTMNVPAIVVERPGRTQLDVTARVTGIVTKVHCIERETVVPGEPLFELRLTHEELVAAESDLLSDLASRDVVEKELKRLQGIGEGVIAQKRVLEQEYALDKLNGAIAARRSALSMHGLSDDQIEQIAATRKLIQNIVILAPPPAEPCPMMSKEHFFHVQSLNVKPGQQVEIGTSLCVLADHCQLYIEGIAFEQDIPTLTTAAKQGWKLKAFESGGSNRAPIASELTIFSLGDVVESDTRAFHFYAMVGNSKVNDHIIDDKRFISWKFKPGQRLELEIPVAKFENELKLPTDAVVDEGAESYVFQQNGKRFDRVPVHVKRRDRRWAVIANDGSLFPGDIVAGAGAYQVHLAIENQTGGGIDPHAGHSH